MNKKRKLQANIHDEYRCKNLQQNTGKLIATAHQNENTKRIKHGGVQVIKDVKDLFKKN